ncbi:MAG: hypothetical protein KBD01_08060 [Acidobacteria bacterium]|nr:hypothetical protein [Acidobacteriota bacterium]
MARRTTDAIACALLVGALGAGVTARAAETESAAAFAEVSDLFAMRCTRCHGGADPKMGLSLEAERIYRSTVNVPSRSNQRIARVAPGDPRSSLLYLKLLPPGEGNYRGPRMPMGEPWLSDDELAVVRRWIESFPKEAWGPPAAPEAAGVQPAAPAFHDSYLAHLPTPDMLGRGMLEFRFLHRFRGSAKDAGSANLYGLDSGAWASLGLTYGIGDNLQAGLRRTELHKDYEAFLKTSLIDQRPAGSPVALSVYASAARHKQPDSINRNRYAAQLVLARRFSDRLSLMLVPTYVTRTNYLDESDRRGTGAVGAGAEFRLNSYLALTGEWIAQVSGVDNAYQSASIGLSVRTANHAFQVLLTNTTGAHTDLYAPGGDLDWGDGQFRIGFNISRTFDLFPAAHP